MHRPTTGSFEFEIETIHHAGIELDMTARGRAWVDADGDIEEIAIQVWNGHTRTFDDGPYCCSRGNRIYDLIAPTLYREHADDIAICTSDDGDIPLRRRVLDLI
jgi:hypothetical protein